MNWALHFPKNNTVDFVDVGCGYGGLTVALARIFPEKTCLGMEIRTKVSEYVRQKIEALRVQYPGQYENAGVIRANAMKFLPNFFKKSQLEKMFFLFPDPHFKRKKHKARIISHALLTQYAYLMKIGGLLYIATDVPELFKWMALALEEHPLFVSVIDDRSSTGDPVVNAVLYSTEEGHKVVREGRQKQFAVYERVAA